MIALGKLILNWTVCAQSVATVESLEDRIVRDKDVFMSGTECNFHRKS